MLLPNNKQKIKLYEFANISRFAYNWAIAREQENYKNGGSFMSDGKLRKEFTQLKKQEEYKWLNNCSSELTRQSINDACKSYINFFKGSGYPKFKSKKKSKPSFYVRYDTLQFTETHVKLEKLTKSREKNKKKFNWIKLAETNRVPKNCKYYNPRVTFDGLNWWISLSMERDKNNEMPLNNGIGIDLGIKDLAICSDGHTYKNINKDKTIIKLKKKQKRLQRKISRKYLINKKGDDFNKTKNIIKSEQKLLKIYHRLKNIRQNYLHQVTTEIIERKPSFIVLEDLNIKNMLKNKYLSKFLQEQCLYEFFKQIQYKCEWNNIRFIVADRYFPSSRLCSKCGAIKKDLKLSDRTYICLECGNSINRDYQASVNLMNYGKMQLIK